MADELNIPTHRYYEPRNNIKLAKGDFSKQWIYDSGIQKIDAWINSQPWGNPVPQLFALNEPGVWYDPSDVANLAWRRNLLTWTEQLGNTAVWGYRSATASGGTITASAGGPADHAAVQVATTSGPTVTASVLVKSGTSNFIWLTISPLYGLPNYATAVANLTTGAVTKTQSGGTLTGATAGISGPDTLGFYRITLSAANPTTSMAILIGVSNSATPTIGSYGNVDFTAVGTETIITGGAQLELGSVATDYQRITDVNTEVIERFPTATLYQDTAGTIPVTTPGQAVALMLDKSRGLTLGSEAVTNGSFATDTDWTKGTGWTISGGVASCDGTAQFSQLSQANVTPLAKYFKVSFTLVSKGASVTSLRVVLGGNFVGEFALSSAGTYSGYFFNSGGSLTFALQTQAGTGAAFAISIDNISVRELPGAHATQATAASRPFYGVVPQGGRRNLLLWSEDFSNAEWLKLNAGTGVAPVVTANAGAAPDGTVTADRIVFNRGAGTTNADVSRIFQDVPDPASGLSTNSVYLRSFDGVSTYSLQLINGIDTTNVITVTGAWQRFSVVSAGTATNYQIRTRGDTTQQTADVLVWGAQGEHGSTATPYQRVTTLYDVTEAGVPSCSYLAFDGGSDSMATGNIDFTATDKMTVFAGVRKLSDGTGMFAELSAYDGTQNGAFHLYKASAANFSFMSRGTVESSSGNAATLQNNVLTGIGDISGDRATLRVNGTQSAQSTANQGTGNYGTYPLYIGARAGTSLFFNGNLFGLIVRGAASTADQITSTEQWLAPKTGVVLP